MDIVSRATATANGLTRYYDGVPCANGHVSGRYTKTGACVGCATGRVLRHASRKKTEPFWVQLTVLRTMDDNERDALLTYLQFKCIPAFLESIGKLPVKSPP